jgi:hypothetical protein
MMRPERMQAYWFEDELEEAIQASRAKQAELVRQVVVSLSL